MRFIICILLQFSLFAADFDCIFIGTSPFSLLEALYQAQSGKKVLILEENSLCGGAWQSINACGIDHVDLGCHLVGTDTKLKAFFETYIGCKTVSLDDPTRPFIEGQDKLGWYFSKGCFELIDQLLKLISQEDISLYTQCKAENLRFDLNNQLAIVQTPSETFSTHQLFVTPMSDIQIGLETKRVQTKSKFHHLYLLIQDPTAPQFTYRQGVVKGVSRMMNLTHFLELANTGRQLIVFQTHGEQYLESGQAFLDELIAQKLVAPTAYILDQECHTYETGAFCQNNASLKDSNDLIVVIQTGQLIQVIKYIDKWKKVLAPIEMCQP
ncbi:MAG: hypothetical protein COT85_00235 [Chlamydiae bacterium CG10_big_fil_rev_8_21_14_0_10_42_34]|nr:MAG: hypothetical protein COT85_00235 [Chlamydiae bacterium CG10_big_fil_rev_8_21_14_0_10_42_34]